MTADKREVEVTCTVLIEASDDAPTDWLSRVTTDDFPYWHLDGSRFSENEGVEMLAYNAVANGVEDALRLDGWGDLEHGMVTMRVVDVEATS